jgi:hypothetical protein
MGIVKREREDHCKLEQYETAVCVDRLAGRSQLYLYASGSGASECKSGFEMAMFKSASVQYLTSSHMVWQ